MQREASTPLPRITGGTALSGGAANSLPRIRSAPIMPNTPPALSHYVDLMPARVPKRRAALTATIRPPADNDLERIRRDLEARERQEAEHWGYGRKVRPGSRMGLDGRKMPARPPWAQAPDVTYALGELERMPVPVDSLRRSGVLARINDSYARDHSSIRSNNYGRVVPYLLVRNAPLLQGFAPDDFLVPHGKTEKGCVTICEFTQAEGLLHDVLRVRRCDVLMGNHIPCYPEKLGSLLPGLRLCLLQGNALGDRTGPIANGLQEATRLTHLTLSENQIGDDGASKLALALANTTLVSLNLSHNKIANHGAAALAASLTKCPCYPVMNKAIQEGQAAVVEAVLVHGFPVNPVFPGEEPLLLQAARAGSASICECLLDRGADIEARDSRGETAVMLAAANGHKRAMTVLIDRGAEMNQRNCNGLSALMLAARNGHIECLQTLIGIARLLPQKVGVSIRGIRDLQVFPPTTFDRLPSGSSAKSQGSGKMSAWGKVRGASLLGVFGRSRSIVSGSGSLEGGDGKNDGGDSSPAQPTNQRGPGLLSRIRSMGSSRMSLLSRLPSVSSRTRMENEEAAAKEEAQELHPRASEETFGRIPSTNTDISGTHFGNAHVVRTRLQEQPCCIAGCNFGQTGVALVRRPSAAEHTLARLPSVSENEVEGSHESVPLHTSMPEAPQGSSRTSFNDSAGSAASRTPVYKLGRRPSVFSVHGPQAPEQPGDASAQTETQESSTPVHRQSSKVSAALARAPAIRPRPSMKAWGSGETELLLQKALPPTERGVVVDGFDDEDSDASAQIEKQESSTPVHPQSSKVSAARARAPALQKRASLGVWGSGEAVLLQKKELLPKEAGVVVDGFEDEDPKSARQEIQRLGSDSSADNTAAAEKKENDSMARLARAGAVKKLAASSIISRLGSFGKQRGSDGGRKGGGDSSRGVLTQAGAERIQDTVFVRLSVGRDKHKQEFVSPPQEVPCKSGTLNTQLVYQFSNVNVATNARLKLELLYQDSEQSDADAKSIGLCVQDLDDLLEGQTEIIDGWFNLHDFVTRRKIGALKCSIRCMPEQFYAACHAGDNVVIHAARNGSTDCVRLLLDAGISVNFPTRDGNTPLIVAAMEGKRETVELLLRHGADTTIRNRGGFTALDMAEKFEREDIVRVLKGVRMQQQQQPFVLDNWPSDYDEEDPMAFLKDRYRGQYKDSQLVVQVVKARHLPKSDAMGLSDPFVEINLNGMKHCTKVVKNSLQPSWDETFSFDDQSLGVWVGQEMKFEVYDWDFVGDSDLIGSVKVDIATMAKSQPPISDKMGQMWLTLRDEDDKIVYGQHNPEKLRAGELQESQVLVRYRFTPATGRFLEMGILEARNVPSRLPKSKKEVLPSPFATVSVGGIAYRTDPVKGNADPKWHKSYRFSAKSMLTWMSLEIHELSLARKKTMSGGKILDPGEHSLIGRAKVPFHKLFSLSNVNLKNIWVELTDADGLRLKDSKGNTSALRIGINFMVLGEDEATWGGVDFGSLHLERNTKLNPDIVESLMKLIEHPSLKHAQADYAYQKLTNGLAAKIPLEGMVEAAQIMGVDLSSDVLMLRMLMNTKTFDYVINFEEFCKVLNLFPDGEDPDEMGLEMPVLGKNMETSAPSVSPTGQAMQEETSEQIIDKDIEPAALMRVVLSKDALERRAEILQQGGDGVGTIVSVNTRNRLSKICTVVWDKTGLKEDFITGFAGEDNLALFEPPKSTQDHMLKEVVIQKDVPARVGMRVVVRKLILSLHPDLAKQSNGKLGTIVWIEPANAHEGIFHGARVEVVWDGSHRRRLVNTGLNGEFHLALHEVASHITMADIALLGTPHLMSFMQTLNLDHNQIGDEGATALAASLKGNWMLKRLSLKHNRIAREGGNEIGLALQENTVLQELYLNLNVLGDDGIVRLSHALGTSTCKLKVLDLEGNQLSYVASRLLAHALAEAKNLDTLLLRNNLVGGDGAGLLEQGLRHSSSVTYLDLERNVLGDIGMRCLMRAMRRIPPRRGRKAQPDNRSIRKLNVCCNNITDACIEEVAEALYKNITLRTIMTDQNEISDEGRKKIDSMLAANVRRADLEKRAIKIQCLFRGRMERLARAKEGGEPMQAHATRAPKEGDLVNINLLQGNLKRFNGKEGRILSVDFDEEHRQWFSVKLDDNIRVLPIRCPKKSVTIVKQEQNELETEYIEKPDELVGDAVASQSQMLTIADDASGALPKSEEGTLVPIPDDTRSSGGAEISKVSGMSDLALQEWPGHHPSIAGSENNTTTPSAGEPDRPKTYGGKSVKERDLMMTAAKLTVLNMGDALMQQQAAAEEMAREAGRKCLEAAEHYAELEAHLKAVIVDEDTSEEDVKIALQALTDAEQEAVRMMQEADEAEVAARRAFLAMSNFERFEQEEAALEKAISGLDPGDDSDWENQLTNRRSMCSIDEVGPGENEFSGSQGVQSHKSSARSGETKITPERTSKWAGADAESALEKTATAGASVSAHYKQLREMLEDENATVEVVEAAVAEFNRTQDAALATFASAVKALEDEALSLQVYHEDSEILVNRMRQEMADAFARLQALQDADASEAEFAEALSDFSKKNAQISQLVVRAEIFRLGSSWSESSSRRDALSPGRNELVELVAKEHLSSLLERAHIESVKYLRDAEEEKDLVEGEQYYTSKEEAAAMLIQTIARGNAVRSKSKILPNKKTLTAEMKAMFEKKYSDEQMQAILKIQGLARGDRDRRLVRRKKRLGQVAVQQDYLNFLKSRTPEERERLEKEAAKIQARFRGGTVRTSQMGQELGVEQAADIFEQVTGIDMTGSDAVARFNRQQLAERLAKNQKSLDSFYNQDMAKRELAAVIVQKRVRGMQTRGRMSQFTSEPTEVEEQHLRSMMDTSGMMIHHTTNNQTEQAGEKHGRAQKSMTEGFLSDMKAIGARLFNSSAFEFAEEEDSNYLSILKNTKSSMSFQGRDSQESRSRRGSQGDVGGVEGAFERGLDRMVGMSVEVKNKRGAEKEAAKLLSNIRHQALAEMEEDLADEEGLLKNVVYDGMMEESRLDDSPDSDAGGGVSFFNLKEYRAMKRRKEVVDGFGKSNLQLILNMCGHHLANLDGAWGLSDPYLKFCRINEDGSRSEVLRTTVIDDNLDPQWPTVKISLKALCRNDSNATFRIECWDSDASFADPLNTNNDDLIGYIDTTVEELKKRRNEYIPLVPPSPEYLQIKIHSQLIRQGVDKATAASQALAAASAKAADLMHLGAGLKAGGAAAAGLKKGMSLGLQGASIVQGLGAGAMSKVGLGALGAGMSKVTNLGADAMAKGMGLVHSLEAKGMEGANMLKDLGTGALSTAANLGKKVSEAVSGPEQQHEGEGPADYGPGFISVAKICQLQAGEVIFEADYVPGHGPSLLEAKLSENETASTSVQTTDILRTSQQTTLSAREELERFFGKTRQKALEIVSTNRPGKNAVDQRVKAKTQSPLSKVVNVRQAIPSALDESSPQVGVRQRPVLLNDSGMHGVATIPEANNDSQAPEMTGASHMPHLTMPHIHLPHMPHIPSSLRAIHDMFSDDMVLSDNTKESESESLNIS